MTPREVVVIPREVVTNPREVVVTPKEVVVTPRELVTNPREVNMTLGITSPSVFYASSTNYLSIIEIY